MATDSPVRSQASASARSKTRLQPQDSTWPSTATSPALGDIAHNRLSGERMNLRPLSAEEQAYRDGYASGRSHETYNQAYLRQSDRDQARANANAAASGGWLLGISMAAIMGLVGAMAYGLYTANSTSTNNPTPVVASPSAAPPSGANVPEASSRVEKQTSVIERTIERVVPPTELRVNVQSSPVTEPAPAATSAPAAPAPASQAPASAAPEDASAERNVAELSGAAPDEMQERAIANPID